MGKIVTVEFHTNDSNTLAYKGPRFPGQKRLRGAALKTTQAKHGGSVIGFVRHDPVMQNAEVARERITQRRNNRSVFLMADMWPTKL